MKILYINPLQERHGSTFRARNLSRLLSSRHQVSYIEPKAEKREGVNASNGNGVLSLLRSAFRFWVASIVESFDVLFLQKPMVLTLPALVVAKVKRKGVALDFDDLDSGWQASGWKKRLALLGEKVMPGYADAITTHNEYLRDYLTRTVHQRIILIPQGVDTELFDPCRYNRQVEKKRLGLEGKNVFCFLGSFTKGSAADLDVILKAFAQVSAVVSNAFLMIIGGGGPLEDHYLGMIDALGLKNVLVTGRKEQMEIPRYLSCADYGLVFMRDNRSNRFRMSLKALEYLSMELHVIGHLVGGTQDTLGKYCINCLPSSESLGRVMLDVLKKQPARNRVRDMIVDAYDWKKFVPLLDTVMNQCDRRVVSG